LACPTEIIVNHSEGKKKVLASPPNTLQRSFKQDPGLGISHPPIKFLNFEAGGNVPPYWCKFWDFHDGGDSSHGLLCYDNV